MFILNKGLFNSQVCIVTFSNFPRMPFKGEDSMKGNKNRIYYLYGSI